MTASSSCSLLYFKSPQEAKTLFLSGGTNRSRHTSLSFNAGKMHSENHYREEVLLIEIETKTSLCCKASFRKLEFN